MTAEGDELLNQAQKGLALTDVYVRECSTSLDDRFLPFAGLNDEWEVQTRIQTAFHRVAEAVPVIEADGQAPSSATFVEYKVVAGARFVHPSLSVSDVDGPVCAAGEIVVVFAVVYRASDTLPNSALGEFGRRNAPFHVWPYWREYLHSTTGRMRLPPAVLPMFKFSSQAAPPVLKGKKKQLEEKQVAEPSINIKEKFDLAFWSHAMGSTQDQLREAVAAVGSDPASVRGYLAK